MHASQPKVILFDLGGVLADLGDPPASMNLDMSNSEFWEIWLNSSAVHDYENGEYTTSEFARKIALEFGESDTEGFERKLRNWQLSLYPDSEKVIRAYEAEYRIALLSNTNELHWEQVQSGTRVFESFEKTFLSFETHAYKPSESAFRQVVEFFGCDPEDVVFLDDNEENIRVAQEVGFLAERVDGITEADQAIRRFVA